jgi:hypothetical protein
MKLLIHADPGARSGFVAAWLTNKLTSLHFDSGVNLGAQYHKIHNLNHPTDIKKSTAVKIRIRPTLEHIDLLSLLFLRKNVHTQIPTFTKNEYCLETFTKLAHFSQEIFQWDTELEYSLYDHVINFEDTFDNDFMIEFYKKLTGTIPSQDLIDMLIKTNKLNNINIDQNHACSILKLTMVREQELGLKEEHRFWSIVDIYNTTSVNKLYDVVFESIKSENYGIFLTDQ